MRRALDDLGVNDQRPSRAAPPSLSPRQPAALSSGTSHNGARPQGAQPAGSAARRNRFAGSADVPVVHLSLGRGLGRSGRSGVQDPLGGLGETAPAADTPLRPPADDRVVRDMQTRLDSLQTHLHHTQMALEEAQVTLQQRDDELAALKASMQAPSARQHTDNVFAPEAVSSLPETKPARIARSQRPKVVREPKPVRWWIKPKG